MIRLPLRAGIASILTLFVFTAQSHAVPVTYVEGNSDLSGFSPLQLFTFDIGVNTISGTTALANTSDFDSFAFTVPGSFLVTGGSLTLQNLNVHLQHAEWQLGTGILPSGPLLATIAADSPGFATIPSLQAGSYHMFGSELRGDGIAPGTAAYTFSFNVVFPEPASPSLLALGLLPLLRRKGQK